MNKHELAVHEVESVLDEWLANYGDRLLVLPMAQAIVERLIAKGVIQSTDPNDLLDFRSTDDGYRTGPLKPGRTVVSGREPTEEELREARDWRRENFPGISDEP